jgi:hypothetical protein
LLLVLLLAYPVYKGLRELFWVKRNSHLITKELKIKITVDPDILAFQDPNFEKEVVITNLNTGAKLKFAYTSLEQSLFFYIDSTNPKPTIKIVDQFSGQNIYDISTLRLLSTVDNFIGFSSENGCNDECLKKLGKPYLVYDYTGFHN